MEKQELKNKIIEVIEQSNLGSVATITDGKPWVRYMVIHRDDDLDLYTTTFVNSRKVAQIKENNNVHIAIGGDPKNWEAPYLNIQATAQVVTDSGTRKKCWSDMLKQFFSGPEDPNYAVIKIFPELIEYMSPGAHKPEIYATEGYSKA